MGSSQLTPDYPDQDHLYFNSPEAHANCSRVLIEMGHNHSFLTGIDNPCVYLWNSRILDTVGIGGVEGGEFNHLGAWWPQILVQFLYGIVCLIGLAGNTLVIYVVCMQANSY